MMPTVIRRSSEDVRGELVETQTSRMARCLTLGDVMAWQDAVIDVVRWAEERGVPAATCVACLAHGVWATPQHHTRQATWAVWSVDEIETYRSKALVHPGLGADMPTRLVARWWYVPRPELAGVYEAAGFVLLAGSWHPPEHIVKYYAGDKGWHNLDY